jgi:hypothetical protein
MPSIEKGPKPAAYVVRRGRKPGVYFSWEDCKERSIDFRTPISTDIQVDFKSKQRRIIGRKERNQLYSGGLITMLTHDFLLEALRNTNRIRRPSPQVYFFNATL